MLHKAGSASLPQTASRVRLITSRQNGWSARTPEQSRLQVQALPVLTRDWKQNRGKREQKVATDGRRSEDELSCASDRAVEGTQVRNRLRSRKVCPFRALGESHEERADTDQRREAERPVCSRSASTVARPHVARATDPTGDACKSQAGSSDVVDPRRCSAGARKAAKFCESEWQPRLAFVLARRMALVQAGIITGDDAVR